MNFKIFIRIIIFLPVILIYLSACATIQKTSFLVNSSDSIKIGYTQLKVLLYNYYDTFSSTTEQAANYIIENADDTQKKKLALKWKINAIAEARSSLSLADPYAALIDSRALCYQVYNFFTTGKGKDYFGEYQYVAIEASEQLVKGIDDVALQVISRKKFDNQQAVFLEWVAEHPIQGPEYLRTSTISLLVEYIGDDAKDFSSSLGSIEEALTDIRGRLTLYSQSLPKQAHWQAELLIEESLEREEFVKILRDLDTIATSLHELNGAIQELDVLIAKVAEDSFREIDRQRLATLVELKSERRLIIDLLQSERQIVLDAVSLERQKTVEDAEQLTKELMSSSSAIMYDLVDHVFLRIIQLSAISAVLIFAALFIIRRKRMSG